MEVPEATAQDVADKPADVLLSEAFGTDSPQPTTESPSPKAASEGKPPEGSSQVPSGDDLEPARQAIQALKNVPREKLKDLIGDDKNHPILQEVNARASSAINETKAELARQQALAQEAQAQAQRFEQYKELRTQLNDADPDIREAARDTLAEEFSEFMTKAEQDRIRSDAQAEALTPERLSTLRQEAYERQAQETVKGALEHPFFQGLTQQDVAQINQPPDKGGAKNWADWHARAAEIALKKQGWLSPQEAKSEIEAARIEGRSRVMGYLPQPDNGRGGGVANPNGSIDLKRDGRELLSEAFEEAAASRSARRN